MKKAMYVALAAAITLSAGNAFADELWNPHLRGTDEGLAAGALPPQGVYFIDDAYMGSWKQLTDKGNFTGTKLDVFVDIPILLWNPGIKLLGADYAVAIAQPFDYTNVYSNGVAGTGNGHVGTFNTVVIPGMLSWALPYDFHVKGSLAVYVDDASSTPAYPAPAGGAGAGNGFWTVEPGLGISWLHSGWNVSAQFMYDFNTEDSSITVARPYKYDSGDQFAADYTVTKALGKWTVGAGAYQENQIEKDKKNGTSIGCTTCGTRETYGAGPIVGYDFGAINLQATYNFDIMTHNDFGGDFFNLRAIVPLY